MKLEAHLLAACAVALGCGGAQLAPSFPENDPHHENALAARLAALPTANDSPIVVGVTRGENPDLVAFELDGRERWRRPIELRSAPRLAGDFVVTHEASGIVVRSLVDGSPTSHIEDGHLHLAGAAGDGTRGMLVLSTGGAVGARSQVIGLDRGRPSFRIALEQPAGEPAVRGDLGFLPWAHQNLSALDLGDGHELARLHPDAGAVAAALRVGDEVVFGRETLTSVRAPHRGAIATPTELPGRPLILRNAYDPPPAATSATSRVRLVADLSFGADGTLEASTPILVFYRFVFALESSGRARWARTLPHDAIGAAVTAGQLSIVDDAGTLHRFSTHDGRPLGHVELGTELVHATVRGQGRVAPSGSPADLLASLTEILQTADARLSAGREFAVQQIVLVTDPAATDALLDACANLRLPIPVRSSACAGLSERRSGIESVLAALERHGSFVLGVAPPPVGPLALAALMMDERRAIPPLLAHLQDPATSTEDLRTIVEVLAAFGDPVATTPLIDFLRLYHAEDADPDFVRVLVATLHAVRSIEGPAARELLAEFQVLPTAPPPVRAEAQQGLDRLAALPRESPTQATAEAEDPTPRELTQELVVETVRPHEAALEQCLVTPTRVFGSARVVAVVDAAGAIDLLTTAPPAVQTCVAETLRGVQFPRTRTTTRQTATFEIRR